MKLFKTDAAKNAFYIGSLCSVSYLAVYIARNVLSAATPQILENGVCTEEHIGSLSSVFFLSYAIGQLINGFIGEKVKAKYMIGFGLVFAGIFNLLFTFFISSPVISLILHALIGLALAMIYAPMTKVIAENTDPLYAPRCSLGYNLASFLGSPLAGLLAAFLTWQLTFHTSSFVLLIMGIACLFLFSRFEKKGIITYGKFVQTENKGKNKISVLLEHEIVKFTLVSILTGIIRTSVVFWLPTYFSQYLGFSSKESGLIFTVTSLIIAANAFLAVFMYEKTNYNMNLTLIISFAGSCVGFLGMYLISSPFVNIVFAVLAILLSNCAASVLWSIYCPSLRDTGMVSSATGFLDFASYGAAALASSLFANAANSIGWKNLILIWLALMVIGTLICTAKKKKA